MSGPRSWLVGPEAAGERLDKFLTRHCPELGRQGARWLSEEGLVTVDGRRSPKARRLQPGELVEVRGQWGGAPSPEPHAPLRIVLERAELVVVDKPAGQATAPLAALESGSLAAALLGRYPEMSAVGYRAREPGLLHRLDTPTSGLVIAARSVPVFEALREALTHERLHKRYLAIVQDKGVPDAGVIARPLVPDPGSGRVRVAELGDAAARERVTRFVTLERRGPWALLEVTAPRAYRHQVRVHLASEGWPIAGDLDYGGPATAALPGRHALHASHVSWEGGEQVAAFSADSPLPDELRRFFETSELGEPGRERAPLASRVSVQNEPAPLHARALTPREFCSRVIPALAAREAENNLPFGIALRLAAAPAGSSTAALLSVESDAGVIVAAAVHTPPHELVVTRLPPGAASVIAEHLAALSWPVSGVSGPDDSGRELAECLAERAGGRAQLRMRQWVYALTSLSAVPLPAGAARRATQADHALVQRWFAEFIEEARLAHAPDPERWAQQALAGESVWFWEDDGPRALASQSRETPNGRGIGPVYTPPEGRRRGYASALVAELARQTLASGKRFACLFTDAANPTSNHIYESIGFVRICGFDAYALEL